MPESMSDIVIYITSFLLLTGAGFMLLAAVGIVRLPDVANRLHASTKAGALGASLMLLALAIFIPEAPVIARALAIVVFIILTSPVSAHVIGRTGYFVGVPLWTGTLRDDLAGRYDSDTHGLTSGLEEASDEEDEEEDEDVEGTSIEDNDAVVSDTVEEGTNSEEEEGDEKNLMPLAEVKDARSGSSDVVEG